MTSEREDFAADPRESVAELRRELAACRAERDAALAREAATAEILQVINSSLGDLAPIFDAMLEKALRLCEAAFGVLFLFDNDRFVQAASRSVPDAYSAFLGANTMLAGPGTAPFRFLRGGERSAIHEVDLSDSEAYRAGDPQRCALVDIGGAHSAIQVPLCKGVAALGVITLYRREVRPFTEKQIALLESFAAQAVIAMENARLLTETREALAQQTATTEVLQVINSSPGDLAPVFEAILEKAHALGGASRGTLFLFDGEAFRAAATHGYPAGRPPQVVKVSEDPRLAALVAGERLIHVPDLAQLDDPVARAVSARGGVRTNLLLPLRKDGRVLGVLSCNRAEVRLFSDKQIALLENFAAQAVIAMENARLLGELRERAGDLEESLEYQTATSDVLQVISRSTFDLQPVLDTLVGTAAKLCGAEMGMIAGRDGAVYRAASVFAFSPEWDAAVRHVVFEPGRGSVIGRAALMRQALQVPDLAADAEYAMPEVITVGRMRTALGVPLLREGEPIGVLYLARQRVEPFTDRQIDLVRTFADQGVIAIENARLLTELRESLEQQQAIAEVLQVINASPGELAPVFEAILEKVHTLCGATLGSLFLFDGELFRAAATHGYPEDLAERLRHGVVLSATPQLLDADVRFVHNPDLTQLDAPTARAVSGRGGVRTNLMLPLRKDGRLLGVISCNRQEVRRFTDKQIALIENFAAQAVIAMENARLITETREALEQQTATAEVLQVINSAPGDLAPVFDAMLQKAMRLCEAKFGTLWTWDGECMNAAAVRGASAEYTAFLLQGPHPPSPIAHRPLLNGATVVHIDDLMTTEGYRSGSSLARAVVELGGVRTLLAVALRKDAALLGVFSIYRDEVRPFTEKQVALLESFAAQAVIAMDNARLLDEIRRRQAELRVTFDNMGDGVAMFDAELHLAAWNRNFQEILDLPDDFVAERPKFADYFHYLAARGEYAETDLEAELSSRLDDTEREIRFERTRPDGRVVEVRRNPVPDGGFVLIYSDVTERKRAESEIRAARDAAEKALGELQTAQASLVHAEKMASLGQLTAGIAHEIKNPLNFVNNFAGLSVELLDELKEAAAPAVASLGTDMRAEIDEIVDTLSGNLAKIGEHGKRADGIVTSMLAHSRGTTGERQKVDLNALVEEALNLAYHGARAQDQDFNIAMERAFEPRLAPIEVVPQDLTRVFLNLFGNGFYAARKRAREQSDGFRPVLNVTTRELGDMVEVRVRDNGAGIPPEIRDKLFQPFFTTKPTGEGTGLGLSISWDIVTQQHGGTIAVASEPGQFTEFTVRLPRRSHANAAAEKAKDAQRAQ